MLLSERQAKNKENEIDEKAEEKATAADSSVERMTSVEESSPAEDKQPDEVSQKDETADDVEKEVSQSVTFLFTLLQCI